MSNSFRSRLVVAVGVLALLGVGGCQRQQSSSSTDGKTYTPDGGKKGGAGGGGEGDGAAETTSPKKLNSPAETTTQGVSQESDNGSPASVGGQAVTNPGAPDAGEQKAANKQQASGGH